MTLSHDQKSMLIYCIISGILSLGYIGLMVLLSALPNASELVIKITCFSGAAAIATCIATGVLLLIDVILDLFVLGYRK